MKLSKEKGEKKTLFNSPSTFGADSRAVGSILQISQRRALFLAIVGRFRLIVALRRFLPGLPRLRGLLLLLLLLLLCVGRHCLPLSPAILPSSLRAKELGGTAADRRSRRFFAALRKT